VKTTRFFAFVYSSAGWAWLALLALAQAGCNGGSAAIDSTAATADALTVGFIYIGARDDYGYNQAHADGAAAVKTMPGVRVVEEERVPDTVDVQKTMKSMIELEGATVIFPTSFGYFDPHVLELARQYPQVTFVHCGGLWDGKVHPANISSYFGYIDECQYLSGIVAGHTTRSKKLGFVAGKPIPQVLRNVNAFTLGARSVDGSITCTVVFTGDWSLPVKEAEATNSLIDQGIDVITCHVNSPKVVIENAEKRGIWSCGYHCNQAALAPKGYLTGAEWSWQKVYTDYVAALKAGQTVPHLVRGGLKEMTVKPSPYGPAVREAATKAADAVKAKFLDGSFVIFKGPLKDNAGKVAIPEGTAYVQTALELESMDYLVEGVIGR
jgi:simple sugar transport system substrate-binding protein